MNSVYEKHEIAKPKVIEMLKNLKNGNDVFSLTLDEWASQRKRTFININIYTTKNNFVTFV